MLWQGLWQGVRCGTFLSSSLRHSVQCLQQNVLGGGTLGAKWISERAEIKKVARNGWFLQFFFWLGEKWGQSLQGGGIPSCPHLVPPLTVWEVLSPCGMEQASWSNSHGFRSYMWWLWCVSCFTPWNCIRGYHYLNLLWIPTHQLETQWCRTDSYVSLATI